MKQNSKNTNRQKKSPDKKGAKASYIGAGLTLIFSFVALVSILKAANPPLSSENLLLMPTLPPQATEKPFVTPSPSLVPIAPQVTIPPSADSLLQEEDVIPTAAQPDTLEIILPADGEISIPFTSPELVYSKTLGDWRTHAAIDISADQVSEVKAAADGTVIKAYKDAQMGYTIVLQHNETYKTIYQNLASCEMVKEGQPVTRGQCIAAVGNSASAELLEESHLHFALLAGDTFLNPLDFVIS